MNNQPTARDMISIFMGRGKTLRKAAAVGTMEDPQNREFYANRIALIEQVHAAVERRDWKQAHVLAAGLVNVPARPPSSQRPQCDATTRKGERCKMRAVWITGEPAPRNGKCRIHGGLSTGPKTLEGKAAIAASNRRRAANSETK